MLLICDGIQQGNEFCDFQLRQLFNWRPWNTSRLWKHQRSLLFLSAHTHPSNTRSVPHYRLWPEPAFKNRKCSVSVVFPINSFPYFSFFFSGRGSASPFAAVARPGRPAPVWPSARLTAGREENKGWRREGKEKRGGEGWREVDKYQHKPEFPISPSQRLRTLLQHSQRGKRERNK